jgi:hypothetical protein
MRSSSSISELMLVCSAMASWERVSSDGCFFPHSIWDMNCLEIPDSMDNDLCVWLRCCLIEIKRSLMASCSRIVS